MKLVSKIKELLRNEYVVAIYDEKGKAFYRDFDEWGVAVLFARTHTTLKDHFEIECTRNGKWRWTSGICVGGMNAKMPKKGGLL